MGKHGTRSTYLLAIITGSLLVLATTGTAAEYDNTEHEFDSNSLGRRTDSPEIPDIYPTENASAKLRTSFTFSNKKDDHDNHKPLFNNCASYKPSVEEEKDRGAYVITVNAVDNDPKNNGGTVTYRIVERDGVRQYFNIDSKTGVVTTNVVFDRDEPSRQKEVYLTVQAIDNGRPILVDLCTFKVTITDINDNQPVFDKLEYIEQVSEDLKTTREVMRVFAYDYDDGENSRLTYSLNAAGATSPEFLTFFAIDPKTGVINLKNSLANKKDQIFKAEVKVNDNGQPQRDATAEITIEVVGSDKRPPEFTRYPQEPIILKENFTDYEVPLATIEAASNIEQANLQFELVKGKTIQTNRDQTFLLAIHGDTTAAISLVRPLDYETVNEYQLTVRVTNKDSLVASISFDVKVEDVNDEIPTFIELVSGSVLENEEPGAQVMQVRAIDKDGTSANNVVSYELQNYQNLFEIDRNSGKITTKMSFDREEESVYNVIVVAKDNSPSALLKSRNEPNTATQAFRINIEDRNDNKPQFTQTIYHAGNVLESTDRGKDVIEVHATDRDTSALIIYSITAGNIGDAFYMENTTGRIRVNNKLDFEKIESYNLTVQANDGLFSDNATVIINIGNVNDELPVFDPYNKELTIEEESDIAGCILNLKAYDPDIKERNLPQNIIYKVSVDQKHFLSVSENDGCVAVTKRLDRDPPNGFAKYQAFIHAYDDGGGPNAQLSSAEFNIILTDINDNAPFLNITEVVWMENQFPGDIVTLTADDYDSSENGPPFSYAIADTASSQIQEKFAVIGNILRAKTTFDREQQKYYMVPIAITDSGTPSLTGTSYIKVIIGDENDNPAEDGASEIFVYNYNGQVPNVDIGRIYVEDPDDWDLKDKFFQWDGFENANFRLNNENGTITMVRGTIEGHYDLRFIVTEENLPLIPKHEVKAVVTVTVKNIPEEAVRKSGSIRLQGATSEEFIEKIPETAPSKKDLLQRHLAKILNTSLENVDVFTVLPSPSNDTFLDVRFSAHGSPYYSPEKLNAKASENQEALERELNVQFVMISISECLEETVCPLLSPCNNMLNIKNEPAVVFTNKTSFVGVQAVVEAVCQCLTPGLECFNGGTLLEDSVCSCPEGFEGSRCELLAIGFYGDGWAMYPTIEDCNGTEISLEVQPQQDNGLIFYVGPLSMTPPPLTKDFMSFELRNGYPVLLVDYGTGTTMTKLSYKKLTDGASHTIKILLKFDEIQISVDDCHQSSCMALGAPTGNNRMLNVNGPLQVGGARGDLRQLAVSLGWNHTPTTTGFTGCIRNFTSNNNVYNLGVPGEFKNAHPNCNYGFQHAATFGIDSNFLVAILVCVAILLILLLAVVVHRRKQDNWNEKDSDDIRETIINYEDEGGGEVDTGFDMSVLRSEHLDDKPPIKETLYKQGAEVPDINGFLKGKKDTCDRDPNNIPFDDVRYYAYEGDGNSTGSLSSLASCTDDGDLKFNYLSNFGPRFRKLADMYGEDPSDEDSQDGGEESWC